MNLSFNGKGSPTQPKERRLAFPAVASAKAGQPPKCKIDGWEAVIP
jgi:hypothetical protein